MKHDVTVRFHHVDAAGILYFSRVFELCHEMLEELLRASGFPLNQILESRVWLMPIVQATADYRKPMLLGERLSIGVQVAHIGKSSLTFHYQINDLEGILRADAKLVHVVLDAGTFRSRPIPEDFLQALEDLGLVQDRRDPSDL